MSERWTTFEIITNGARPVALAMAAEGIEDAQQAAAIMWRFQEMVQDMGWQKARMSYRYTSGTTTELRVANKGGILWLLKCKKGCWRVYFYVDEPNKRIIYVHGVCKKKGVENVADTNKAIKAVSSIAERRSLIGAFQFPTQ